MTAKEFYSKDRPKREPLPKIYNYRKIKKLLKEIYNYNLASYDGYKFGRYMQHRIYDVVNAETEEIIFQRVTLFQLGQALEKNGYYE